MYIQEPVIITYERPREKVLFNAARDANPTFHLYESLWMLAGRNDVQSLSYYNSNIARYSDDGKTFNGAYGHRWRHASAKCRCCAGMTFVRNPAMDEELRERAYLTVPCQNCGGTGSSVDQLKVIIDHLRAKPDSRRAVLQMWNVESDLLKIGGGKCRACGGQVTGGPGWEWVTCHGCNNTGVDAGSKDTCCNLSTCFAIRTEDERVYAGHGNIEGGPVEYLDLTVFNRSNDLIWGTLGANAVHFAFLLEYMAAHLGVEVGVYNQVSNNQHIYLANWKPEEWLDSYNLDKVTDIPKSKGNYGPDVKQVPLVRDPATFDRELPLFVERHSKDAFAADYEEPFLRDVAQPMCLAWHYYKNRDLDSALTMISHVVADDWRSAGTQWLERRKAKRDARRESHDKQAYGDLAASGGIVDAP